MKTKTKFLISVVKILSSAREEKANGRHRRKQTRPMSLPSGSHSVGSRRNFRSRGVRSGRCGG